MTELLRYFTILIIVSQLIIYLTSSIQTKNLSGSENDNFVFGLPLLLIAISLLGSWLTVGIYGIISISGPLVLVAFFSFGKIRLGKPVFNHQWHITGLLTSLLFFGIKGYTLYDNNSKEFLCTFHDDYLYINQINLIKNQGTESEMFELMRRAFGLDYEYKIYHYAEFYFILFFKYLLGGNTYFWFHFFLKPILSVFAVLTIASFFNRNKETDFIFYSKIACILLFFTTLRFNLLDDQLAAIIPSKYWKSVFFQNYYFPSPVGYHVSYKLSIAFIVILPVFQILRSQTLRFKDMVLSVLPAITFSIAFVPYCILLLMFFGLKKIIPRRFEDLIIWTGVITTLITIYFVNGNSNNSLLKYLFNQVFTNFNLIFENFYWHFFYIFLLILIFAKSNFKLKLLGIIIIGFPLIYLNHEVFFKIYLLIILVYIIFIIKKHLFLSNIFVRTYLPLLFILGFSIQIFSRIANLDQVFSNLLFPIICLTILEFLFYSKIKVSPIWIVPFILLVNLPAIIYDNKTPLHKEKFNREFFFDPVFKLNQINALSISSYHAVPHLYASTLGSGIVNKFDNIFISMAGLENLSQNDYNIFKETGYEFFLKRLPAYQELILQKKSIRKFIRERNVKIVFIEDKPRFQFYYNELKLLALRKYYESEKGYHIFVLN